MHAADWVAIVTPALAVGSIGVAGIVKLTRLIDAVERGARAIETMADKVQDHERRITHLEAKP